jgi:hypothetical protein
MTATNNIVPDGTEQSWDSSLRLLSLRSAKDGQFPPVVAGFVGFWEQLAAHCGTLLGRLQDHVLEFKATRIIINDLCRVALRDDPVRGG